MVFHFFKRRVLWPLSLKGSLSMLTSALFSCASSTSTRIHPLRFLSETCFKPTGYVIKRGTTQTLELEASTSSGRAGAVGMLQAILQAMLQGAGPVGCCPKVLRGVLLIGRSACRAFCSWVLVPGVSCSWRSYFWRSLLLAFCPRSWALRF